MQIQFTSISEPGLAGKKWLDLFTTHWEAYKKWLLENEDEAYAADLFTSQEALKTYMPKLWPTYVHLCQITHADELVARFLTGYKPPSYVSGCSNAVIKDEQTHLIRNYDHHPDLFEGVQILTRWNHKKVIATSDCLIGVLDGMNEDGLAVSLTFGGRKKIDDGFGMPFILRYVLEFCANVEEAVVQLMNIPSHMAYNVTLVDSSGHHKTMRLAPGEEPVITTADYTTNHQKKIRWPENAAFNKTVERSTFLKHLLTEESLTKEELIQTFLRKPLYNNMYKQGFGTLFTAAYSPESRDVELHWPHQALKQSFLNFKEESLAIQFQQKKTRKQRAKNFSIPYQGHTAKNITYANPNLDKEKLHKGTKNDNISTELISEVWSNIQPKE
jgi:predicted choloylglycine hydrolase